jgi:hypothetical protein
VNRLLRVADLVDGAPVAMPRVLAPLVPEAYALQWSIVDLGEVVAGERWDHNLTYVEQRVDSSPRGFELSSADMLVAAGEHGHWLVSAPDNLLERYETRFALVSEESPWSVELSGWGG